MASIHPESSDAPQGYLVAKEPDYKNLIQNAALRRRMSRIVKMGVGCAMECIGNIPQDKIDAIITATGLGCLADTEKFMDNLLDNHEQLLSPTPFIQSTHNTVGAQIAQLCNNQRYNMTYVHRGLSFESALLDGLLRLSEGDRNVLAGGFDEMTPTSYAILKRLGAFKTNIGGEGSQFFLLSNIKTEESIARIATPQNNSFVEEYLQKHGLSPVDIDLLVYDNSSADLEEEKDYLRKEYFPDTPYETFKKQCGEYQTATAFAVWQTAKRLSENKEIKHALIHNNYRFESSLILMSQP